jgi:hypothetical protein
LGGLGVDLPPVHPDDKRIIIARKQIRQDQIDNLLVTGLLRKYIEGSPAMFKLGGRPSIDQPSETTPYIQA